MRKVTIQMLLSVANYKSKVAATSRQKVISYFNMKRVVDDIEDVYRKITKGVEV